MNLLFDDDRERNGEQEDENGSTGAAFWVREGDFLDDDAEVENNNLKDMVISSSSEGGWEMKTYDLILIIFQDETSLIGILLSFQL